MRRVAFAFITLLLIDCGTLMPPGDVTIYRNPDTARTVLTALETLRYQSAKDVSKAYLEGRISKEKALQFERVDEMFRSSWRTASDLVRAWQDNKGAAPPDLQARLNETTMLVSSLEIEARRVNDGTSQRVP